VTTPTRTRVCRRCPREEHARGLCTVHYPQHLRAGLIQPQVVAAAPLQRHLRLLLATGEWTRAGIARAAHVDADTVSAIAAGRRKYIHTTVAGRLATVLLNPTATPLKER
jgi:hypothetical protein